MNKFTRTELLLMLIAFMIAVMLYIQLKVFALNVEAFQIVGSSVSSVLRELSNLRTQ